jgi:putative hemolysin
MSDHLSPFPWIDVVIILALVVLNAVLAMSEMRWSSSTPFLR